MASASSKGNRFNVLMDGDVRLDKKEKIIQHILKFYSSFYSKEDRVRPLLNNLRFETIGEENASWLEREFEEEIHFAVFALGGDRSLGPNGFPMAFFQFFLNRC